MKTFSPSLSFLKPSCVLPFISCRFLTSLPNFWPFLLCNKRLFGLPGRPPDGPTATSLKRTKIVITSLEQLSDLLEPITLIRQFRDRGEGLVVSALALYFIDQSLDPDLDFLLVNRNKERPGQVDIKYSNG